MISDWRSKQGIVKVGLASDHGGFDKKELLKGYLPELQAQAVDFGPFVQDPEDDYPDFANDLCKAMIAGEIDCGILICKSGIGMAIIANRYHGLRAALVETVDKAGKSRTHNDSNILIAGGAAMSDEEFKAIVAAWLKTPFSFEERHTRRLEKIERYTVDETAAIRNVDPEIAELIEEEGKRQASGLELIASENFASVAVRSAMGTVLTNKYAEGKPGKRYYNGCEVVDKLEQLAIDRVKALFGAEAANVQPHSGSQANQAAYQAVLQPGDTVLGMSLDCGGHLTHGSSVNFSGKLYNFIPYGISKETEMIDYDELERLAVEHQPKLILFGASAYPRIFDMPRLRAIADKVGCLLMMDMAHVAGLIAAGVHPNPVPYCDIVTSTTHKTLRGPRGGIILCKEELIKKINSAVFPGCQGGPLEHVIAAKAICFKEAMSPEFKAYGAQVVANCKALAAELTQRGFRIVSGGTDNHVMLVDLRPKHVTGRDAADAMDLAGITVNKNMIPFDPEKPAVTSGIRVGTAAVTTRGLKEPEMAKIADFMTRVVENINDPAAIAQVRAEVQELIARFPMPQLI